MSNAKTQTFRGFDVQVLRDNKHYGPALIGKEMHEAAQAFCSDEMGGGDLGPAMTGDPKITVRPITAVDVPPEIGKPIAVTKNADANATVGDDPWSGYTLVEMRDLMKANNLEIPRALSYGKAEAALEAAGIKPNRK
jgi:hypothetical protein